jgi:phytoene synthase
MSASLEASYQFCEQVARREARNFYYAFRLLPPDRRRAMCVLYAFMRQTDDLADEPGEPGAQHAAIAAWRRDLERLVAGETPGGWAGFPALGASITRHAIPPRHLAEVINGVEQDIEPREFATFDELRQYCYLVASAVGLCCLAIWGYDSRGGQAERLAEDCGIALQLTNIVRDVPEDLARGRIYLPRQDLARFGVTPEDLRAGVLTTPVRDLLAAQAARARGYYASLSALIPLVDPVGRPVLRSIVGIYRALLEEIDHRGYDVFSRRVALSRWRKTTIAVRSLLG